MGGSGDIGVYSLRFGGCPVLLCNTGSLVPDFPYLRVIFFLDVLCRCLTIIKRKGWIIIVYPGCLSLDVASQFVAIRVAIRRDSRSTDVYRSTSFVTKRQRRLLIKLIRNIHCKCIKNINTYGDGGWDLGCTMEVNVRYSYVYCLTLVNNNHTGKKNIRTYEV